MMKCFQLFADTSLESQWWPGIPKLPDESDSDVWSFSEGKKIDCEPLRIPIDRAGPELDFTFSYYSLTVINERVADALRPFAGGGLQLIDANLDDGRKMYIPNITNLVDCLDREKSGLQFDGDRIQMVTILHLKRSMCEGLDFFRISGWPSPFLVSDAVARALLAIDPSGVVASEIPMS